ncbi:MAG: hypothetical protein ACR2NP_07895 [Pirellulaceae bacterium]
MNEDRKKEKGFPWVIVGLVSLPFIGLVALASLPLLRPDLPRVKADRVNWTRYTHAGLGVSLDVPESLHIEESSDNVSMSLDGSGLVFISWISENDADDRGLWGGRQPNGDTKLGGVAGKKYVYDHFDALAGVHTIAHVVPFRDKFLALEFRTRRITVFEELGLIRGTEDRDLNQAELRMLNSFRFESD